MNTLKALPPSIAASLYVLALVVLALGGFGCNGGEGDEAEDDESEIAEEAYSDTFERQPADALLESGRQFPETINVQILNGTSIGSLPMDPAVLQCPPASEFTAFAHNWTTPATCDGYRDASSPLVQLSEQQATNFISGITCPAGCTRNQSIVWRGWACGHAQEATLNHASGMAVSMVSCTP